MKKTTTLAGGLQPLLPLLLFLWLCAPLLAQSQGASTFYLTDALGNLMAELTTGATDTGQMLELGTTTLPEDQCSLTATYYLYGFGGDGRPRAGMPLVQATFSGPENGSSVTLRENAAGGVYALDVEWEEGEAWLSITVSDGAGAQASVYLHAGVHRSGIGFLLFDSMEQAGIYIYPETFDASNAIGDTLKLLSCNTRGVITLKLVVTSFCALQEEADGIAMSAGSLGVSVAPMEGFINERRFRVSFNGPGDYTFNLSYTTPGGQLFTAAKSITVAQPEIEDAPICIAAISLVNNRLLDQDTIDVPQAYCASGNSFLLPFFISASQSFSFSQVTTTPNGSIFFTSQEGENQYYVEIQRTLNVNPQGPLTSIRFNYQGYQKTFYFRVVPLEEPLVRIFDNFTRLAITYEKTVSCAEAPPLQLLMRVYDRCFRPLNIHNFSLRHNQDTLLHSQYINYWGAFVPGANIQPGDSLHASYLAPDGNLYANSWPIRIVERWPDHWPPVFLAPPADGPVLLPAQCAPGNLAIAAAADDRCAANIEVADGAAGLPDGLTFIPFDDGIALLRAAAPGQYAVGLTATDQQGNSHTRTHLLEALPLAQPQCAEAPVAVFADAFGQATLSAEAAYTQLGEDLCADSRWALRVLDALPEDGPLINGCGAYAYQLLPAEAMPSAGFTGAFAPDRWALLRVEDGQASFSEASVELSAYRGRVLAACTAPMGGQLSFQLAGAGRVALLDAQGTLKGEWASAGQVAGLEVAAGDALILYRPANTLGEPLTLSEWRFMPVAAAAPLCTGQVVVVDTFPPTITLAGEVVAAIPEEGQTTLSVEALAASYTDNCGDPVSLQVRRQYAAAPENCSPAEPYWSDWGAAINVGCCDLCDSVLVEVRGGDQAGLSATRQAYVFVRNGGPAAAFYPPAPFCAVEGADMALVKYFFAPSVPCVGSEELHFRAALDLGADGLPEADISDWVFFAGQRYGIGPLMAPVGHHQIQLSIEREGCALGEPVLLPFTVAFCDDDPPADQARGGDAPPVLQAVCLPNPFRHTAALTLSTPMAGLAEIELFDAAGRVQHRQAYFAERGEQRIELGDALTAGLYFYRIRLGGMTVSGKMLKL